MAEEMNNANATVNNEQPNEAANNVNAAPAGEQQNNGAADEKPKKKRKMPKWLSYVLVGLGGTAVGAGITALVHHFTGVDASDSIQSVAQTVQPTLSQQPQQAIGTVVNAATEAAKAVSEQQ